MVKPALTPEQWANSYTDEEGVCVDGRLWFAHGGPAESLHAIGAVCFYGKPFGFTWEMVALLHEAADAVAVCRSAYLTTGAPKHGEEGRAAVTDIANLIESLLPPEAP
jgi:hypothetical protein